MSSTNIIFLDIDGVLNSRRSIVSGLSKKEDGFDPIAVNLLKKLCEKSEAGIVITSYWRKTKDVDYFIDLFRHYGWKNAPVVGLTPVMEDIRDTEIRQWMSTHFLEIYRYVVLDNIQIPIENFVLVDENNGLSYENYCTARKLLDPTYVEPIFVV